MVYRVLWDLPARASIPGLEMNRKYYDLIVGDICKLKLGNKPLVIVSAGKDILAYETASLMADELGLDYEHAMMRCEDGQKHEHVFIGRTCSTAIELVNNARAGEISRPTLQFRLGSMLGYDQERCLQFVASAVGRECPCDCCGGPFVSEEITG